MERYTDQVLSIHKKLEHTPIRAMVERAALKAICYKGSHLTPRGLVQLISDQYQSIHCRATDGKSSIYTQPFYDEQRKIIVSQVMLAMLKPSRAEINSMVEMLVDAHEINALCAAREQAKGVVDDMINLG